MKKIWGTRISKMHNNYSLRLYIVKHMTYDMYIFVDLLWNLLVFDLKQICNVYKKGASFNDKGLPTYYDRYDAALIVIWQKISHDQNINKCNWYRWSNLCMRMMVTSLSSDKEIWFFFSIIYLYSNRRVYFTNFQNIGIFW